MTVENSGSKRNGWRRLVFLVLAICVLLTAVLSAQTGKKKESGTNRESSTNQEHGRLWMEIFNLKNQVYQAKTTAFFSFNLNRYFFMAGYFYSTTDYSNVNLQVKDWSNELDKIRYKYILLLYTAEKGTIGHTYEMVYNRLVRIERYKTEVKNALATILQNYREVYVYDMDTQRSSIQTTLDRYGHLMPEVNEAAALRLQTQLFGPSISKTLAKPA